VEFKDTVSVDVLPGASVDTYQSRANRAVRWRTRQNALNTRKRLAEVATALKYSESGMRGLPIPIFISILKYAFWDESLIVRSLQASLEGVANSYPDRSDDIPAPTKRTKRTKGRKKRAKGARIERAKRARTE
jgi:hypothetical protein